MLPSFSCGRSNAECIAAAHRVARHSATDQRHNLRRHRAAVSQAAPRRGTVGGVVMSVFVLLSALMAAHALHVEQRQQQQFQEWRLQR